MNRSITRVTLVVREYDEAISFFVDALGFRLVEDTPLAGHKRWVVVAPPDRSGASLLLARAADDEQLGCVGRQAGGRVFLFLQTSDFWMDYERLRSRGVDFEEQPREEPYGTVAVFRDLYGNRWDLVGRNQEPNGRRRLERTE